MSRTGYANQARIPTIFRQLEPPSSEPAKLLAETRREPPNFWASTGHPVSARLERCGMPGSIDVTEGVGDSRWAFISGRRRRARPPPVQRFRVDVSGMALDQMPHDERPRPGASVPARWCRLPENARRYSVDASGRDPHARVSDLDARVSVLRVDSDRHLAAVGRELDCIVSTFRPPALIRHVTGDRAHGFIESRRAVWFFCGPPNTPFERRPDGRTEDPPL